MMVLTVMETVLKVLTDNIPAIITNGAMIVIAYLKLKSVAKNANVEGFMAETRESFKKNDESHNAIFTVIRKMNDKESSLNQIRHAVADATEMIYSEEVKKMLNGFSNKIVSYVQEILDIGIENLTESQILLKYSVIKDEVADEIKSQMFGKEELVKKYLSMIEPIRDLYLNEIKLIFKDINCFPKVVNNVNNRFSTETLRFVQKVANETVKFLQVNRIN